MPNDGFPTPTNTFEVEFPADSSTPIVFGLPNSVADLLTFSLQKGPGNLIFIPLVQDTFDRADENPLNPSLWGTLS